MNGLAVLTADSMMLAAFGNVTSCGVVEMHHTTSGHDVCLGDAQYYGAQKEQTRANLLIIRYKVCFNTVLTAGIFMSCLTGKLLQVQ